MLVPPQLPPFLATIFDLKPITGVPSGEEVKLVHATIRSLSTFLQISYRERYPVAIFPNVSHGIELQGLEASSEALSICMQDITYTPPDLPAHIPVKLEPVIGPPSDDEIRSAHSALRMLDSFANIASLFDADLSAQLSQHSRSSARAGPPDSSATEGTNETRDADADTLHSQPSQVGSGGGVGLDNAQQSNIPLRMTQDQEEKNWPEATHKLLVNMGETLRDVKRALIGGQNSLARGFNSVDYNICSFHLGVHSLINDEGETPEMHGLPTLQGYYRDSRFTHLDQLSPDTLARYLRFYNIGSEMIDDSDGLTIKSGMEKDARAMLERRVYTNQA